MLDWNRSEHTIGSKVAGVEGGQNVGCATGPEEAEAEIPLYWLWLSSVGTPDQGLNHPFYKHT